MGFYRNKHPPPPENKQKYSYPASSQTQRGPVQLFSGQGKHLWNFQFAPTKLNPWRGSGQLLISNRCADPEGDRWSGHPPPQKKNK